MSPLPKPAKAFLGMVVSSAVVALVWTFSLDPFLALNYGQWWSIIILFALYLLADIDAHLMTWYLPSSKITITVSTGIDIAVILLFGPHIALPFVALAVLATELRSGRPMVKIVFNVAVAILYTGAASLAFGLFGTVGQSPLADGYQVVAWLFASAVHVLVNSGLLAIMIGLTGRLNLLRLWRDMVTGAELQQWTQPPLGALIAVLQLHSPAALLLAILPLLAIYIAYRRLGQLNDETCRVLETLADTLDQRDPITARHSQRVTEYVQAMLTTMRSISHSESRMIMAAARIHDLGKVAVRDAFLHKTGPLEPQELLEMQQHPVIGARLLQPLSLYRSGLEIVRHHHERWDGTGYPDGLRAEQIPLGARVLAVADAFDAMTSDRPYRRALSAERALDEIIAERGRQFDPRVVDAFLHSLQHASARPHLIRPGDDPRLTSHNSLP